jgi:hypothetical protein
MNNSYSSLLDEFDFEKGATLESIAKVELWAGLELPQDYKDFLLTHNGGEGFVNDEYVIFWAADELAQFNREYEVSEYAPGLLLFGSNGGGEAYAYDLRESPPTIVMVPFIGMALKHTKALARTLEEFIRALAGKI